MAYVFKDAVDVKVESDDAADSADQNTADNLASAKQTESGSEEWWRNLSLQVEYLKTERGEMQFYRENLIGLMRTSIEQLTTKKWAKASVSSFVKEVFYNKEGFFTKDQIEEIDELMAAFNNDAVLSSSRLS